MRIGGIGGAESAKKLLPFLQRERAVAALILLAAAFLVATSADAAPWTLLRIENIGAGGGAGYHFSNNSSKSDARPEISSSEHAFIETLNLSGDFSLLNPHIINGSAGVNLRLNQRKSTDRTGLTGSSSNINLGYQVSSVLLDRKPASIFINANSYIQSQSPAFSPSFDLESDDLTVTLNIKNKYLPSKIGIGKHSSETSGLPDDRRQSTESFTMSASNTVGSFSTSSFSFYRNIAESALLAGGDTTGSTSTGLSIGNSLIWAGERQLARRLSTGYNYGAASGFFHNTTHSFTSTLLWDLGKALKSSGNYNYTTNLTQIQSIRQHSGTFSLSHRLFESLTTSLSASASSSSFNDGSESSYGGGLGAGYTKKLPSAGLFALSYSFSYAVSDRERLNAAVNVENERHAIPLSDPKRITLANPSFQGDTIEVRGAQTPLLYTRDIDYIVIPEGIEVLPGHMLGDTEVLISYTFIQDPMVTYATTGHGVTARLDLNRKRHSIYANYHTSSQQRLRGAATTVTLTPTTSLNLGFESRVAPHTFGAEYGLSKTFGIELQYLDSRWLYHTPFAGGNFSLGANDRFTWYDVGTGRGGDGTRWGNVFSVRGTYDKTLTARLSGKLRLAYINSFSGSSQMSNLFSMGVNLDGHFGKTVVSLTSSLSYGMTSTAWSRSEAVSIAVNRAF